MRRKIIVNAYPHSFVDPPPQINKIMKLGWDIFAHTAYLPDLASMDCHLRVNVQNYIENFISSKPVSFYFDGICRHIEK